MVKDIRMPPGNLWKPDILMYNRYSLLYSCQRHFAKFHRARSGEGTYSYSGFLLVESAYNLLKIC